MAPTTKECELSTDPDRDLKDLIEWMKRDPEKLRRIIAAEDLVDRYGSIEIIYHDGKVGTIIARQSRQC